MSSPNGIEYYTVCPYCYAETVELNVGDEGLTYCSEDCGCLEGTNTLTVTEDELNELLG